MIHSADIRRLKDEAQLRAEVSKRDSEIKELKDRIEALTIKVEMLQEYISNSDDKYNSKTNNNG